MSSGTNNRQRQSTLSARFNEQEARDIRARADRSGVSVATLLRSAVLNGAEIRATRRPTSNHEAVARLLGELGRIATVLRDGAAAGGVDPRHPAVAGALRDLSEMRLLCLQALGRKP